MTDVKFMDLSENDNPATTDSILIGNSTDGLKRTSVGAIGNLFSAKPLLHTETVTAKNTTASQYSVSITAPDVPGYTFAFWLETVIKSSSLGGITTAHIDPLNTQQTVVWLSNQTGEIGDCTFKATAVYVNSKAA